MAAEPALGATPAGSAPAAGHLPIAALVVDVDGVLRRWVWADWNDADRAHGLQPGSLHRAVFARPELQEVVTGQITDQQWREGIAERLARSTGASAQAARGAVADWSRKVGAVDDDVLELLRQQRSRRRVVLLSNATDRLDADLEQLDLTGEVDGVYATWRLGVAKPDPQVYALVAADLQLPTSACAFVDDSPRHVRGAREAGMLAHHFTGAPALAAFLEELDRAGTG